VVKTMTDLVALNAWADGLSWDLHEGLIQNHDAPMTRQDAASQSTRWMLRFRYRICEDTGEVFDITEQGFLYRSGAIA
jgi:hypothetical protein